MFFEEAEEFAEGCEAGGCYSEGGLDCGGYVDFFVGYLGYIC